MRVRLFHTDPAEGRTSMERYSHALAAALRRVRGTAVDVEDVFPRHSRLQQWLARTRRFGTPARYWGRYVEYQRQTARAGNGDVNHIVDHGYSHLAFSLDPSRTVITFHDAMLLRLQRRELPTSYYPRLTILGHQVSLRALQRVARVITDSESTQRDLAAYTGYPPDRIRVAPLGVDPAFFLPDAETGCADQRKHWGHEPYRILHVGHTGFYKNIEGVLQVIARVQRKLDRPVVLVKAGAGFSAEQERLIARLGIEDRVCHLGLVPAADLPATYRRADLLLFPSFYEGFGLPVLEAMASGLPVVASDRGSLPEVAGDAGVLVNPKDIAGMSDAVAHVLTDGQLRRTLGERGRARAAAYTWDRTAAATLAVYREVAGG